MEALSTLFSIDWAASAIRLASPLFLVALGALICERAGVLNIATEGIMLGGAFGSVAGTVATGGNLWLGLVIGAVAGCLIAAIMASLTVLVKADQVVAGIAINIFILGATSLGYSLFLNTRAGGNLSNTESFAFWAVPWLSSLPVLGPLFVYQPTVYIALFLAPISLYVLFRTRVGLTLRSVGENASAADTLGIDVTKIRFCAVLISGILGGLGGASLALAEVHGFLPNMTSGRGYIALAVVIVGKWQPLGALAAAVLFGAAEALQYRVQGLGLPISRQVPNMIPYVLTLLALLGIVGRSRPPAEDGKPYIKGET